MKWYYESEAKKDYRKLSKDTKQFFTEREYIKFVLKKRKEKKEREK